MKASCTTLGPHLIGYRFQPRGRPSLIRLAAALLCMSAAIAFAQTRPSHEATSSESAVLARAARLRREHKPTVAVQLLRSYLQNHPGDADVLLELGGALLETGDRSAAEKTFASALAANPASPAANDAVGQLLLDGHHDPEAMDRFETSLATSPRDTAARKGELSAATELAVSARQSGHPEAALEVLRHASSRLPDDPQLLLDYGIQADELAQFPEAEQSLHAAQILDPKNPTILYALARLEMDEQHLPDAERDLKAYLAMRPEDASAHYGLGNLYSIEQRTADARAEFEISLRLQPHQTESYFQLGQLDLDAHQDAAAQSLFQKTLASNPNHAGALTGMGELALRAKQYATAEEFLTKAEKADPNYAPPHYYRGLALARLGRKEEAEEELHRGDSRPHATPQATDSDARTAAPDAAAPNLPH